MVIPSQEENRDTPHMFTKIRFHVYRNLSHCTLHGRRPQKDHKTRSMHYSLHSDDTTKNVYTRKEIVLLETSIK